MATERGWCGNPRHSKKCHDRADTCFAFMREGDDPQRQETNEWFNAFVDHLSQSTGTDLSQHKISDY